MYKFNRTFFSCKNYALLQQGSIFVVIIYFYYNYFYYAYTYRTVYKTDWSLVPRPG